MAYNPLNPNGQAAMANSQPVVIASNQTPVSVAGTLNTIQTGTVRSSISGTVFVDVVSSVAVVGSFAPSGNQSVSGTVGASVIGTVPVTQSGAWSASLVGTIPGSVVAFQGGAWTTSVVGTVNAVTGNSSIITVPQGSVAAVIIGGSIAASFTPPANQSVSGAVSVSNFPTTQNVSGSVVATQGTNPWTVVSSLAGGIFPISGSVAATIIGTPNVNTAGSVVAFQGTSPWIITGSVQGTLGASIIGLPPVNVTNTNLNVSGSVAAWLQSTNASVITVGTAAANQSVSGTVGASIVGQLPAGTAVLGSVAALQGTNPWVVVSSLAGGLFPISGSVAAVITNTPNVNTAGSVAAWLNSSSGSVISVIQGSVATVIIGGSIAASFTPPANQSVSGTVGASVIGTVPITQSGTLIASIASTVPSSVLVGASIFGQLPGGTAVLGSVAALQGTNPWNIAGSVAAFVVGNASVITVPQGSMAVAIISGSIAATFTPPANQSVSGTVGASIIGTVPVVQSGINITSISGTIVTAPGADTIPATASVLVGVTANTNGSVLTTTGYQAALLQITSGPGASITGQINFEGTADGTQFVPIQGYNISNNTIASAAGVESDWAFNIAGLQGVRTRVSNWTVGSITARINLSPEDARPFSIVAQGNQSVSGTVGASIIGVVPIIVTGSVPAQSVSGAIMAQGFNAPNASVTGNPVYVGGLDQNGSVQGAKVVTVVSVAGGLAWLGVVSVSGTIAATQSGTQITSIVGSYSEDAGHTSGDTGVFVLGVRNDTMSSITSSDIDYSPIVVGPVGETIVANSPITKWVQGTASMLGGAPVTGSLVPIIAAQGSSVFTYITGLQIANASANNAWITLLGATNSVVGYTVAPANGGSNIYYQNALKTNANAIFSASISAVASVYLSAQGFISKT